MDDLPNPAPVKSHPLKDEGRDLANTILMRRKGPIKILLVEDDPSDADLAKIQIQQCTECDGCKVDHVWNGEQAVEKVQGGQQFDAALVDLILPGMSGIEAAKRMVGFSAGLVIFICSGAQLPQGAMSEALASGYIVLPKPLVKDHLRMIFAEVKKKMSCAIS